MDHGLASLARVMKALTDPTRLRILGLLQAAPVCVCHIHESLGISQPKASRHLAYLRRAGIVATERRGNWVHYRIAPPATPAAKTLLDTALRSGDSTRSFQQDKRRLAHVTACGSPAPMRGARRKARD
jgi:ArsR family transcriptional regulator